MHKFNGYFASRRRGARLGSIGLLALLLALPLLGFCLQTAQAGGLSASAAQADVVSVGAAGAASGGLSVPGLAWGLWAKATKTPKSGGAAGSNAYDVIAAVNSVRSANGLAPYQTNGALMAAAQAHSDYQASIGSTTHTGSGGSNVKGRVLAAGYGGGADVSAIENIYGGMNATAQQAVTWWQGDSIHLNTLLSTRHNEAGAGVSVSSNGVTYYTLDVGSVVGGSAPPPSSGAAAPSAPGATGAPITSGAAAPAYSALLQSTPGPDGSIVHEVQAGQTLWTIAAVYKADINDLLRINGLYSGSWINPGQKIIIREAGQGPQETVFANRGTPADDVTPTVTATRRPPRTLVPTLAAAALAQQGEGGKGAGELALAKPARAFLGGIDPLLAGIVLLVVVGIGLVLAGNLFKRV